MKLSILITVSTEEKELDLLAQNLTQSFSKFNDKDFEVVFLLDEDSYTQGVLISCQAAALEWARLNVTTTIKMYPFGRDFASFKNYGVTQCKGEYVLQLDVDELPSPGCISGLLFLLYNNPGVDAFAIARRNTVEGLTPEDIAKWNWRVTKNGYVNYPDWQQRILKNNHRIKFSGKIHTEFIGQRRLVSIPDTFMWIEHPKEIDRQRQQNALYDTMDQ